MGARRFEDLKAWQKARTLNKGVFKFTEQSTGPMNLSFQRQIRRAALSVMSNVAEGFDRGGDREFIQYLYQAKGSCAEVRSQLHAGLDMGLLDPGSFTELREMAEETSKVIQGLIRYLSKSELKGRKFS
ncbi:MAG: four helix bundle protein [bacterium]|nr:MAG: four helix bundle protein [bacterium]